MRIKNEVANVLANSKIEDQKLYLPDIQLNRKLYMAVNKVLITIGGKWNRKAKAHIFDCYPNYKIEEILLTGEYTDAQKEYQFFETPDELAMELVQMAKIQVGESVLEPSAGRGAIAKHIKNCDCIEFNSTDNRYLCEHDFNVVDDEFLGFTKRYDVIVANPPFAPRQNDITHITHMIELANRCVVSVASQSVMWRTNKKSKDFRELVSSLCGTIKSLPENSFKTSGTKIDTCIIYVDKLFSNID